MRAYFTFPLLLLATPAMEPAVAQPDPEAQMGPASPSEPVADSDHASPVEDEIHDISPEQIGIPQVPAPGQCSVFQYFAVPPHPPQCSVTGTSSSGTGTTVYQLTCCG